MSYSKTMFQNTVLANTSKLLYRLCMGAKHSASALWSNFDHDEHPPFPQQPKAWVEWRAWHHYLAVNPQAPDAKNRCVSCFP